MQTDQESVARLKQPIPVHLGYWTAWMGPDGQVRFTEDPYQVDRRQAFLRGHGRM